MTRSYGSTPGQTSITFKANVGSEIRKKVRTSVNETLMPMVIGPPKTANSEYRFNKDNDL